jgi:hypothetical protein
MMNATTITLTTLLLVSPAAHATLLTNGTPSTAGEGLTVNTFMGAESFMLSIAETVQAIEFAEEEFVPGFTDTLNYAIFDNSGFFPGTMVAQGSNPVLSTTYLVNGGNTGVSDLLFDFNLNTPVTLQPGTYWVGINFSGSQFAEWLATTTPNSQLSAGAPAGTTNWNLDAVQLYIGVSSTPLVRTPEPGSTLFVGVGMMLVMAGYRRRRVG